MNFSQNHSANFVNSLRIYLKYIQEIIYVYVQCSIRCYDCYHITKRKFNITNMHIIIPLSNWKTTRIKLSFDPGGRQALWRLCIAARNTINAREATTGSVQNPIAIRFSILFCWYREAINYIFESKIYVNLE